MKREFSINDAEEFIINNPELFKGFYKNKKQLMLEARELADDDGIMDAIVADVIFGERSGMKFLEKLQPC